MNFAKILAGLCFSLSSVAFTQNVFTRAPEYSAPKTGVAQGVRVAFVKPLLDAKLESTFGGQSHTNTANIDSSNGLSIGYVYIPIQTVGFIADLSYIEIKEDGTKFKMWRTSGSGTFGLNSDVYFKGGLNLSELRFENGDKMDPRLGLQAGAGLQLSKNLGFELNYVIMNQYRSEVGITSELQEKGVEFGITGTF